MASERYIYIPNWDDFQHYKGKDRPAWIKVYPRLLRKDEFLELSTAERMALVGIWLLYAESGRRLALDTAKLTRALNQRISKRTLQRLNEAGFIEFRSRDALETLYTRQDRDRELTPTELVKETETAGPPDGDLSFVQTPTGGTPAERLLAEIRDADERTAVVLHALEHRLRDVDFVTALESLRYRRARTDKPPLESEARYAVSALTTMERERQ